MILSLKLKMPAGYSFHCLRNRKKYQLVGDIPQELKADPREVLVLMRDRDRLPLLPGLLMTLLRLVFAPLLILADVYGDPWYREVIPYRTELALQCVKDGSCLLGASVPRRYAPPRLCVGGEAARLINVRHEPDPDCFDFSRNAFLTRLTGFILYLCALCALLIYEGIVANRAEMVAAGTALLVLFAACYIIIVIDAHKSYHKSKTEFEAVVAELQQHLKDSDTAGTLSAHSTEQDRQT